METRTLAFGFDLIDAAFTALGRPYVVERKQLSKSYVVFTIHRWQTTDTVGLEAFNANTILWRTERIFVHVGDVSIRAISEGKTLVKFEIVGEAEELQKAVDLTLLELVKTFEESLPLPINQWRAVEKYYAMKRDGTWERKKFEDHLDFDGMLVKHCGAFVGQRQFLRWRNIYDEWMKTHAPK